MVFGFRELIYFRKNSLKLSNPGKGDLSVEKWDILRDVQTAGLSDKVGTPGHLKVLIKNYKYHKKAKIVSTSFCVDASWKMEM